MSSSKQLLHLFSPISNSECSRIPRSWFCMALAFLAPLGCWQAASATLITHNGSNVLFSDGYESSATGSPWDNGAAPGDWALDITTQTTDAAAPGPYSGSKYGLVERTGSGQAARAQFDAVSSGRLDLDTMVYLPEGSQWLSVALGNNLGTNPGTPSGDVHSYVTFHLNSTHEVEDGAIGTFPKMGFLYKNSEWMRLQIGHDYANAASGYTVNLTTSDGTFNYTRAIENAGTPINTMLIKFEANGNAAYFDALAVPEPGTIGLLVVAAVLGVFYRRGCS